MADLPADVLRFARGECDPSRFPHREHVRMGFEMLRRHSFTETALHTSRALRMMAARAGRPEAYHETITVAFLSLIAERLQSDRAGDFEQFEQVNPGLFDKRALARWYAPARLASDAARRTFLLPDPAQ
jgi:hypothetical protein